MFGICFWEKYSNSFAVVYAQSFALSLSKLLYEMPQKYLIGIFHFNLQSCTLKNVPKINVGRKGRFFRLTFLSISPTSFFLRWWIVRLELNHYTTSWYDSIFGKRRQVLFFFMIYPNYRNTILDVTLLLLPLREVKIRPNLENCRKKWLCNEQ